MVGVGVGVVVVAAAARWWLMRACAAWRRALAVLVDFDYMMTCVCLCVSALLAQRRTHNLTQHAPLTAEGASGRSRLLRSASPLVPRKASSSDCEISVW